MQLSESLAGVGVSQVGKQELNGPLSCEGQRKITENFYPQNQVV